FDAGHLGDGAGIVGPCGFDGAAADVECEDHEGESSGRGDGGKGEISSKAENWGWFHAAMAGWAGAAHPSSDLSLFKRKPTFSLKGRRVAFGSVSAKTPMPPGDGGERCAEVATPNTARAQALCPLLRRCPSIGGFGGGGGVAGGGFSCEVGKGGDAAAREIL